MLELIILGMRRKEHPHFCLDYKKEQLQNSAFASPQRPAVFISQLNNLIGVAKDRNG